MSVSPEEFKEQVRSHSEIVAVVGESVALQSKGREFVGLCPFHDDHNPSMRVYPDRGTFRCWSCQTGGDVFTFVMEREKVTFPEALEILARRANLEMPKYVTGRTPDQENTRGKLFEVLQWAENAYHRCLLEAPAAETARKYLSSRGLTDETIRRFRLGYHPDNWEWLVDQAQGKYPAKLLNDARVCGEKNGRPYDFFVDRVIFPIHNERGNAISFGGRILPGKEDKAKYWNGPESTVFHKSKVLYALDVARDAIKDEDFAIVVEGYTDCIAFHQNGLSNAVATLGTALTDAHVSTLKRFTRKVIIVFDADDPGQNAAAKSVDAFLAHDVDLRVLTLPNGQDPDDYFAEHSAEEFRELAKSAPEAWEFRFQRAKNAFGLDSIDGRQQILEEMLQVMANLPQLAASVREDFLVANLAQRLGISEESVREKLKEIRTDGRKRVRVDNHQANEHQPSEAVTRILRGKLSPSDRMECNLLENLLAAPQYIRFVADSLGSVKFHNPVFQFVLNACFQEATARGELTLSGLLSRVPERAQNLVVWIDEQAMAKDLAQKLEQCASDEAGCPTLLRQAIEKIAEREEEQRHNSVATQLSERKPTGEGLDPDTEELLRQAAQFHQKRAGKNML